MDTRTLQRLKNHNIVMDIKPMITSCQIYTSASQPSDEPAMMVITKTVTLDIELHVTHGTAIFLRNIYVCSLRNRI